jgi:hypothetical protein
MKTARSGASSARKRLPRDEPAADAAGRCSDSEAVDRVADAPRYETFTVRFLLDPSGGCRRTEVSSVQQGGGDAWHGYDSARLCAWIEERIAPVAPAAAAAESAALATLARPRSDPRPILSDLALDPPGAGALGIMATGAELRARLTLELASETGGASAEYTARIFLRDLGGMSQLLGETRGQAHAGERTPIEVEGIAPAPGMYRLTAIVVIGHPKTHSAALDGMLLHVYE